MKKILIGTHNKGKFKEISYLIQKNTKKYRQYHLKLKAQKKQEKLSLPILTQSKIFF